MNANLLLLIFVLLQGCLGNEDEDNTQYIIRGQSTSLTCPIDDRNCGELHSIKWFRGQTRIGVASGDKEVRRIEDEFSDRFSIEYSMDKPSILAIKFVEVDDEDDYSCEITYLDPSDACDSSTFHSDLKVEVPPSAIVLNYKDENITDDTVIGPIKEGQKFEVTCEVHNARPEPEVHWYRKGEKIQSHETSFKEDDLFTVSSTLSLNLARHDFGKALECRVRTTKNRSIVSKHLNIDLSFKPTRMSLTGVTSHTVEGSRVNLECIAHNARPAAIITWFNSTKEFDSTSSVTINTKNRTHEDGSIDTISNIIFTASRFENGVTIRCEAINSEMIDDFEKPLYKELNLEVMYPPVVTIQPHNLTINESEEILLFCPYSANPNSLTTVRWLRNNEVVNLNQSRIDEVNTDQPTLMIKEARRDDKGNYTCELTNQVGTGISENVAIVDVQYKPKVAIRFDPPSPIIENQKVNVTLHCDIVDANPAKLVKVKWLMDGNLLTELPECNEESFENNNIESTTEDDDADDDDDDEPKNQNYFCFIDPTKILLQNVNREFLGNYSCRGYNAAGWGEVSESELLDVYYEPGNATISVSPLIPIKGQLMNLSCSVDDLGNPRSTRFHWFRGNELVKDIVTSHWTIDPVGLHNRNNYSCYAVNAGGNGTVATINIDINVQPRLIKNLPPYSGFLYSDPNVNLSCQVECVPSCSISWFKDGQEITSDDEKYDIRHKSLPADPTTGDFESVVSELFFNMSAWPGRSLNITRDNANYSCVSSNNDVGMGTRTVTSLGVEYPPKEVIIYKPELYVLEGQKPETLTCKAEAQPRAKISWRKMESNESFPSQPSESKLTFLNTFSRFDKGAYMCTAENRHGSTTASITINVLYKPNCTIERDEVDGDDTLICIADGNPDDYKYEWDYKSENETEEKQSLNFKSRGKKSYLTLESVGFRRTYYCRANNTLGAVGNIGEGMFCEITIDGALAWYHRIPMEALILIAIIILCILSVIIVICIIICICRRRRKRSSKSMEKSLMDCKPLGNAEPCENYENLPFHGMQNPPAKFNYLAAPANNLNVNLVHHQQKSFVSQPYSDFYYETYKNSNPNSTMRSVKNYRKPQAPAGACLQQLTSSSNDNYNMFINNSNNSSSIHDKSNNFNYQNQKTLSSYNNKSCNNSSVSSNNNKFYPNDELLNQSSNNNNINNMNSNNISNLSRRSSQSSGSHDWQTNEKSSLSLCINRINLKKSKNSSPTTSTSSKEQFQSMRCRRHRNRNHFFNTSTNTSYQKYKLTKSCSNDTDISDQQNEIDNKIPNTYKFV